jgi:AraC-like DNA-binding protein
MLRVSLGPARIHELSGEEFDDVLGEFFIPVIVRSAPGFRGRVAVQELDKGLTLSLTRRRTRSAVRTDQMAANSSEESLMIFTVQVTCRSHVLRGDRSAGPATGTAVRAGARNAYKWVSKTENRQLTLTFSRELLPLRTTEIAEACARITDPVTPAAHMLGAYLGQLFKIADGLTPPQRLDAGHAAIDLLAMALRDVVPSVPGCDGSAEVLLEMMLRHLREHSADPNLQVEELARRHNVSVSHVYTLFERIGTTPAVYLREQRLLAARAMLADPRCAWLGTTDIAAAVGFVERRTFERAFRRQYGMTPGNWRRERCHPGSAPATLEEEMSPR